MNCVKANQMMNLFFENELSYKDEAEFIKHLESCKDCYKEAETYFMLKAAQTWKQVGRVRGYKGGVRTFPYDPQKAAFRPRNPERDYCYGCTPYRGCRRIFRVFPISFEDYERLLTDY